MHNKDVTNDDLYKKLIFNKLSINEGIIIENVVAQILRSKGYNLYFHEYLYKANHNKNESKYKIDFIIVRKNKICPIEVKSSSYKSHKYFDYFKYKYQLKIEDKFVIHTKDLIYKDGITYIPIYMTYFI